jgi:hypothetical protein
MPNLVASLFLGAPLLLLHVEMQETLLQFGEGTVLHARHLALRDAKLVPDLGLALALVE